MGKGMAKALLGDGTALTRIAGAAIRQQVQEAGVLRLALYYRALPYHRRSRRPRRVLSNWRAAAAPQVRRQCLVELIFPRVMGPLRSIRTAHVPILRTARRRVNDRTRRQ